MRIKLFRAATIAQAMAEIRDALGLDAFILDTTRIEGGVEVTAAIDDVEDETDLFSPLPGVISFETAPPSSPVAATSVDRPWSRHNCSAELSQSLGAESLISACERLFRFGTLPLSASSAPLMLIGLPGSGKTLTIAKLATRLVLEGQTPMVITADDQRAGAVEQLAGFTRLLGLTLIAAGRPDSLCKALARRSTHAPVLIDTPGLDHDDPAHRALVAEMTAVTGAVPALVLPSGLDRSEAIDIADAFAGIGTRHLIATRLDRKGRLGAILDAARHADLMLTEAGVGSSVADGLEAITPEMLAARLDPRSKSDLHEQPTIARCSLVPAAERAPIPANVLSAHIAAQPRKARAITWKATP